MTDDEKTRVTVQMPKQLRDDAKRNSEYGELSEEVREVFRRKAYGVGESNVDSEAERKRAELREVRKQIDDLRRKRGRIETEIEAQESRATRLEERIEALEREHDEMQTKLDMLENMLHNGERMWPVRIKNAANVEIGTAEKLYQRLKDENPDLPESAFTEPRVSDPADWREVASA